MIVSGKLLHRLFVSIEIENIILTDGSISPHHILTNILSEGFPGLIAYFEDSQSVSILQIQVLNLLACQSVYLIAYAVLI